eukprot:scaffold30110_cov70-Phaeocystis_antarctica.AAC.1
MIHSKVPILKVAPTRPPTDKPTLALTLALEVALIPTACCGVRHVQRVPAEPLLVRSCLWGAEPLLVGYRLTLPTRRGFFPLVLAALCPLEPFLADDEALHISEVRGAACNHPFVTAHAGPRTARVAAVVVSGPVPTAPAALGCFGRSGGRTELLESAPVVQLCVFLLRG